MDPRSTGAAPDRTAARTRSRRRTAGGVAVIAAAAFGVTGLGLAPAAAAPQTINLVTFNDFHGRIEQDGVAGGVARLATAINTFRSANENTVVAAAGDLIGASTFTSFIQQDVPTIDALNAAGLDVSAAGNHEFDQGWADLRDRVNTLANWEYIAANVFIKGTDDTALAESWTKTLPNGVTMGFVGAVTEDLPSLVSPGGIEELEVKGIVDSVNAAADRLVDGDATNGEADIVVLLVHEGAADTTLAAATDESSAFGKIVAGVDSDVDAIVSGHTHLPYNHVIDGRPVISSGQYGERFSNMVITYDPATEALTMQNTIYDAAIKNDAGAVVGYNYAQDPAIQAMVDEDTALANVLGAQELGDITADFNRALQPGIVNGVPTIVENRGGESTIGNFVADVQLWTVNQDADVDIAFMNPGGLRTNLTYAPDGVVTYKEAANVQPFANTLVAMTLTGAQVKQVLEEQWQPNPLASRPFLKLGVNKELSYTYDPTAPKNEHITGIQLNGVEIDPAAEYRVVANSFLSTGGDNFVTLRSGTNKVDTGKVDLEGMVDWFAANEVATPDYVQRAVGFDVDAPDAVGDALVVALSSLDFSTTEPAAGTVELSLGGVSLGTQPVDRTLLEKYDEIGRASFSTMVPESVYGWQDLVATVASTGTTATESVFLKATTDTEVVVNTPSPKAGSTITAWVSVESPLDVTGSFEVLVDDVSIGTFRYAPNDEGLVKVKLPKSLTAGSHTVEVVYPGSDLLLSSSDTITLTLK
ncbi:bifunctional metallophosphatase/5'-nucleotidase [Agromyces bauzanensis]